MNAKTALKVTSEHGGPVVLAAGAASLLVALAGVGRAPTVAAAPAPTVTATVTARVVAPRPARTSAAAHPDASPRPAVTAFAVSDARAVLPHTGSGGLSHGQARPPSAPRPTPTPQHPASPAAPCGGRILTVRLLHAACVSIGGGP